MNGQPKYPLGRKATLEVDYYSSSFCSNFFLLSLETLSIYQKNDSGDSKFDLGGYG